MNIFYNFEIIGNIKELSQIIPFITISLYVNCKMINRNKHQKANPK